MKINPRQEILSIWTGLAQCANNGNSWQWRDRNARNSINDAEQLLCLLYPASEFPKLNLHEIESMDPGILDALRTIGDERKIAQFVIDGLLEFMKAYQREGRPVFPGGSYFESIVDDTFETSGIIPVDSTVNEDLESVDSYSMSITLCLATISFTKRLRPNVKSTERLGQIDELESLASQRLTAAMVSLIRSFAVSVFSPETPEGVELLSSLQRSGASSRNLVSRLRGELEQVIFGIRDMLEMRPDIEHLSEPNSQMLFECGWSWGIVQDAPLVATADEAHSRLTGIAEPYPYLYFSLTALDGISDLVSERTRSLGLLDQTQKQLAQELQRQWDITQEYWSTIAMFGNAQWPLENLPWRTTDGSESDYYSLLVTSVVTEDLVRSRADDADLERITEILEELAERGRITRRALEGDEAVKLHFPGVRLTLVGTEKVGPPLGWLLSDYSSLILKRCFRVAELARSPELRNRLLDLADDIWIHLSKRRFTTGEMQGLWDQPNQAFPVVQAEFELPSWYLTERVIEGLVAAGRVISQPPLRSNQAKDIATDLLNEAEHLFDKLLLVDRAADPQDMARRIRRVRKILHERPGVALALISPILVDLNNSIDALEDVKESK